MLCFFFLNNCLQINSSVWLMQHCLDFLFEIVNFYYFQHLPQYQAPATKAPKNPKALLNQVPQIFYRVYQSVAGTCPEAWALYKRRPEIKRSYCF